MHPHLGQCHLGRQRPRRRWGQAPEDERATRQQGPSLHLTFTAPQCCVSRGEASLRGLTALPEKGHQRKETQTLDTHWQVRLATSCWTGAHFSWGRSGAAEGRGSP